MAKLLLKHDGVTLHSYPLDRERLTIGRQSGSDIQLDDMAVSSRHARISREQNRYLEDYYDFYIEDLGSTNGTRVNGQRIQRQMLKEGDTIRIGTYEFTFDSGQPQGMETTAIFLPEDR